MFEQYQWMWLSYTPQNFFLDHIMTGYYSLFRRSLSQTVEDASLKDYSLDVWCSHHVRFPRTFTHRNKLNNGNCDQIRNREVKVYFNRRCKVYLKSFWMFQLLTPLKSLLVNVPNLKVESKLWSTLHNFGARLCSNIS